MVFNLLSSTSSKTMDVDWIEVQTSEGSFVIQNGHAPMILALSANKEISVGFEDGSKTLITVMGGILQVERDKITLFLTHE